MAYSNTTKILFLKKYLEENTDEKHSVTIEDIQDALEDEGFKSPERKTVYSMIRALSEDADMDIITELQGGKNHYRIGDRDFGLDELRMLADAVQVAKFIPDKATDRLVQKLAGLTSRHNGHFFKRDLSYEAGVKIDGQQALYSLNDIRSAMAKNRQIQFEYFSYRWDPKNGMQKHWRDKGICVVSPWHLCWRDDNYYMIAYETATDSFKTYRVDRMVKVTALPKERDGFERYREHLKKKKSTGLFRMFNGETKQVTLLCRSEAAGIIRDQFGKLTFIPQDETHFDVTPTVQFSDQFVSWLLALGDMVRLTAPRECVDYINEFLKKQTDYYGSL